MEIYDPQEIIVIFQLRLCLLHKALVKNDLVGIETEFFNCKVAYENLNERVKDKIKHYKGNKES